MVKRRLWCRIMVTILVVALCGTLLHRLYREICDARAAALHCNCLCNLTQLSLAMQFYHQKYGHFPPAYVADASGRPMHSWRVLLLEFLEPELYKAYDFSQPWDSPQNAQLAGRMSRFFACPDDPQSEEKYFTNYVVVVGETTMFPGAKTTSFEHVPEHKRASTILVVETIGMDIHWMEPRDLVFDEMSFWINEPSLPSISSNCCNGASVIMVDGTKATFLGVGPDTVKSMLTISEDKSPRKK